MNILHECLLVKQSFIEKSTEKDYTHKNVVQFASENSLCLKDLESDALEQRSA